MKAKEGYAGGWAEESYREKERTQTRISACGFVFVFVFVLFASKQFIKTDLAAVLGGTSQHLRLVLCYLDMCRGSGGKEADLGGRVSFFMVHPSIRAEVPASRDRHLSVDSQA